eukprot:15205300-Alexandrium_andersonii.AAC.1
MSSQVAGDEEQHPAVLLHAGLEDRVQIRREPIGQANEPRLTIITGDPAFQDPIVILDSVLQSVAAFRGKLHEHPLGWAQSR